VKFIIWTATGETDLLLFGLIAGSDLLQKHPVTVNSWATFPNKLILIHSFAIKRCGIQDLLLTSQRKSPRDKGKN
jgi:hypothetical protein